MENCRADWHVTHGYTADVLAAVEGLSVNMPGMDDPAFFLEKDAGWAQDVRSVDPRLFEPSKLYRGELTA